jgi:hypothetical protein
VPASRTAPSSGSFLTNARDILAALGRDRSTEMSQAWLQWARSELIGSVGSGNLCLPNRVLRVVAVLTDVPQALGHESLDWVDQDDVATTARNVFGLVDGVPTESLPRTVDSALKTAVSVGLIRVSEWDAWHPGMASGSGRRDQYAVTPLGRKTLSDLGFSPPPPPGTKKTSY